MTAAQPRTASPPSPTRAPAIEIDHLTHDYARAGVRALDDVSLRVPPGEVVGVVGQNGSGKTTLARHLNGLLRPTKGRVVVAGIDIAGRRVEDLAADVGYAFQNPNHQLFSATVEAELAFGPRNLGLPEDEVRARVAQAIDAFGLEAVRALHPFRIPFPIRKLVGIAAVVTMRPGVLVLDEPSTGQDPPAVDRIAAQIAGMRARGTTVICASHDLRLLAAVADRFVVLEGGRLVADGSPREVLGDVAIATRARLVPPPVTAISLGLRARTGRPPALGVPELASTLEELLPPAT